LLLCINVNSEQAIDYIKGIDPDFGIVFGTRKISNKVIEQFPDGLINVHRGISEEYRGLDSDLWAIYHDDYSNIGVTIHKVEPSLDTGDIVYQDRLPLELHMKIYHLRYYTTLLATKLVISALRDYCSGALQQSPQKKKGRYYSFMPIELKKVVNKKFNRYVETLSN